MFGWTSCLDALHTMHTVTIDGQTGNLDQLYFWTDKQAYSQKAAARSLLTREIKMDPYCLGLRSMLVS